METGVYIKEREEKFSRMGETAWDKVFYTFSTGFSTAGVPGVICVM